MNIDKLGAGKKIRKGEWNDYKIFIKEIDEKQPEPSGTHVETTTLVDSKWVGDTDTREILRDNESVVR